MMTLFLLTKEKRHMRGFSLLEVVIAVIVLGVLAVTALPRYQAFRARAKYAEAMQALGAIEKAQRRYFYEHKKLTRNFSELDLTMGPSSTVRDYGKTYEYNVWGPADGQSVGFALGDYNGVSFPATSTPENVKIGMDMTVASGVPEVYAYWWLEDNPGQIGGGAIHSDPPTSGTIPWNKAR
jgi:prepilin-type N-terminal cleavage/methylation domain-containing protein